MKRLLLVLTAASVALLAVPLTGSTARMPAEASPPAGASTRPALTGDLRTHDPSLTRDRRTKEWFVYSTGDPAVAGGTVQIRRSRNGRDWQYAGTVFSAIPAWLKEAVPGVSNLWAPEIFEHRGTYYLYYSASTFGSNRSVIALATNTTLNPRDPAYKWVDRGLVTRSVPTDDYNAIDPGIVVDGNGTPWMAFGSFWSGIRMIRLQWPSGLAAPAQGEPLRLADRQQPPNAVEAPYIMRRAGWYYLFASFDFCCRGTDSTYKIIVGRSRQVTGPYVDQTGTSLLSGGGTVLLETAGTRVGPGGQSVYDGLLAHHYYDSTANGDFRLGLERLHWGPDGWPRTVAAR